MIPFSVQHMWFEKNRRGKTSIRFLDKYCRPPRNGSWSMAAIRISNPILTDHGHQDVRSSVELRRWLNYTKRLPRLSITK